MAIDKSTESKHPISVTPVRDYWPRFNSKSKWLVISMQIITVALVWGALVLTGTFPPTSVKLIIALIAVCGASIGVNLIIYSIVSEPTKNLLFALTHVAGEPTTTTPPNPNSKRFSKTGLKEVLQTVYEMSVNHSDQADLQNTGVNSVLSAALDNTGTGFVVLDEYNKITYHNKAAPIRTNPDGSKAIEVVFYTDTTFEEWLKECEEKSVHAEKNWSRLANKLAGDDDRKIYDVNASYQKGSNAQTIITFFDRTDIYMPEEEDLDFIAFAAHELRGPITVIRGYLDVLQDELEPVIEEEQAELVKRLVVSANRLSSYVNNILNASRYDRSHLRIHLAEDTLNAIYDTIVDDMNLRASSQNRILNVELPPNLPTVAADRASVSEVLGNLIDNAIKYSNEGGTVSVSAATNGNYVEVSVVDQGIGMPGNVVSNLFHKFYRSHRSRETVAGTGIGLYITKAIVESHGGTISARSAEGAGSVFSFTLPIYATVADKLQSNDNTNEGMIREGGGWIKNHSMYRG